MTESVIAGVELRPIPTEDATGVIDRRLADALPDGWTVVGLRHLALAEGVARPWHIEPDLTLWWYAPSGVARLTLYDTRVGSATHQRAMDVVLGDNQPVRLVAVPPGVAHGVKAVAGEAHLIVVATRGGDIAP
ncbi:MAG: hypothetical protein NZ518_00290 [Dehalococcoidia bacterium]|nr:hypothetical protein [Dehalococcoidia bacterium]